jgi:hypothetical protein
MEREKNPITLHKAPPIPNPKIPKLALKRIRQLYLQTLVK